MKTFPLSETNCPPQYLLDWYCEDLVPDSMAWQIENHLCDCQECDRYVEAHKNKTPIIDRLDAAMTVQLFLHEPICTPIAEYEAMLDMTLMSAAASDTDTITPANGTVVTSDQLTFHWKNYDKLQLQIENNSYKKLFNQPISSGYNLSLPLDFFPNGLYYFKLLNGIDLVKIGKFYIYR